MEKVSDYVFRTLVEVAAVKHVFMLPGGGCMHLVDSLGRTPGLGFTCCLHEQAAAIAAEAYAQYTGGLGVALVTAGPGSTNAVTGVAGACGPEPMRTAPKSSSPGARSHIRHVPANVHASDGSG